MWDENHRVSSIRISQCFFEDDVNRGNTNLNKDMIVAVVIVIQVIAN